VTVEPDDVEDPDAVYEVHDVLVRADPQASAQESSTMNSMCDVEGVSCDNGPQIRSDVTMVTVVADIHASYQQHDTQAVDMLRADDIEDPAAEHHDIEDVQVCLGPQDSSTQHMPFHLPAVVQHKGRPAAVKQRTFRKKTVPFLALSATAKDEMRVSWFVTHAVMLRAMRGGEKIGTEDLQLENFTRSLEYCNVEEVQQYFTDAAWREIERLKSETGSLCASCSAEVPPSSTQPRKLRRIKWVECGHCLLWFHVICAGLRTVPKKWFCEACRA